MQMSEENPTRTSSDRAIPAEYIKFGVLVAIFLGIVLFVALIQPILFERIVPAVLGVDLPRAELAAPDVISPKLPPVEQEPIATEAEPEVGLGGSGLTESQFQHTVKAGENLEDIADSYGVSVQAIGAANHIVNPLQISTGTILVIPTEQD
jgi:LysM repeat protein